MVPLAVLAQEQDVEGSKDHPLLSRMPGYYISQYEQSEFASHAFLVSGKEIQVEGRLTRILYSTQPGAKEPSRLQILRNYENALAKIGGTVLTSDADGSSYLKLARDGREVWVHVDAYITSQYTLWVVEKAGMKQDVVADAAAWRADIRSTGRAVVYGITFDTDKATLKPESAAVIKEIAALLAASPDLKLLVVGHTDMTGDLAHNRTLSEQRAAAVVAALVGTHGVAAPRLAAFGVGPLAPVASNDSEEGRAKNRRVELVKR
ncbi:MAG: OmpA family protein [Holophagae bacterium]|nr:OmpA family protein [Holophagae bacterium]